MTKGKLAASKEDTALLRLRNTNAGRTPFGSSGGNNIGQAVCQVNSALTQVGVQIDLTQNFLNQDKINLSSQENTLVGAHPVKAATDFSQAQLANQSTISATGRVLRLPTLLDFIK